ncbi:hypothetical protein SAPIO_CDS1893 [Scedosporium apiospermum]|uniref:CipC-like antibiotic response protein n=1 Tax=Pseudallescheria apiosperma TaxID=563466 RepID=A0A084GDZ6_PSEDA|nr:uncharacterized protein SAPIO_CDS1893 [Scedosporium apiospermum]KEZ45558.1 hypothetical protein SAPIO_CDS1893 [Scedosporium apiospermum]
MFGFDEAKDRHGDLYGDQHQGKFSHEAVAGGAAFEAMKLFLDRQRKQGGPVKHALAKELLMGVAGAEVDKVMETKGMDYLDRESVKRDAQRQAEQMYDDQYGDMDEFDPKRFA